MGSQKEVEQRMMEESKGTLMAFVGATFWGISGCIGQYLFQYCGVVSTWLSPIRLLFSGIILFAFYLVKDKELLFRVWEKPLDVRDLLIYSIPGVACCQLTYLVTIQLASASIGTILQATAPAMILAYTCAREHRAPTLLELFAEVLALVGVFLLSTHGNLSNMAIPPLALLIGLLSAVCVVIYTLSPRRLQESFPTPLLQAWAGMLGGLLFSAIFRPWEAMPVITPQVVAGVFGVVVVGSILGYSFYLSGAKIIGAQKASLISFTEPVVAAIVSTTLLGTPFTGWDAAGFACLFGMLAMIVLPAQR